jgi:hypothetical protein
MVGEVGVDDGMDEGMVGHDMMVRSELWGVGRSWVDEVILHIDLPSRPFYLKAKRE